MLTFSSFRSGPDEDEGNDDDNEDEDEGGGWGRSASSSSSSSSTAAAASSSCSCQDSFPLSRSNMSFSPCLSCVNSSSSSLDVSSAWRSSSSFKVVTSFGIRKHGENRFSNTIVLLLLPYNFRWKINASFKWLMLPFSFYLKSKARNFSNVLDRTTR